MQAICPWQSKKCSYPCNETLFNRKPEGELTNTWTNHASSMFEVLYLQWTNAYTRPNPLKYKENGFCQQHWSGEWVEGISYLTNMKFLIYVMDSPRNWYEIKKMYLTLLSQTLKNYWAGFLTLYTARKKKTSTMMWVEQLAGRNAKACPNSLWTFQCEWCGSQ